MYPRAVKDRDMHDPVQDDHQTGNQDGVPSKAPAVKESSSSWFSCRMCRVKLFEKSQCIAHDSKAGSPQCTSVFVNPDMVPWVAIESTQNVQRGGEALEGALDTIYCPQPRCRAKLGARKWCGAQCSCGTWIAPSFRIHLSRVDEFSA